MTTAISPEWKSRLAVMRLQASKEADDVAREKVGRELGRRWASDEASHRQLLGLAQYTGVVFACRFWVQEAAQERSRTGAEVNAHDIGDVIVWADSPGSCEGMTFWEEILDGAAHFVIDDPAALQGFVEGAMDVWKDFHEFTLSTAN
jgi:hypothetical protein